MSNHPHVTDPAAARARILAEVREIVAEFSTGAADTIREDQRLEEDLGCDSIDLVEITMQLEEHFDISIPEDTADETRTVAAIVDGVMQLLHPGGQH